MVFSLPLRKTFLNYNNSVVVAGGNPGAEFLAIVSFKVLFGSDQDISGGIEPQKLRRPLFR